MTQKEEKRLAALDKKIEKLSIDALSEAEQNEFFELIIKETMEQSMDQLPDIEAEAEQRIWYDRNKYGWPDTEPDNTPEEIVKKAIKAKERIEEQFGVKEEDVDDYYHGYWSGILALCRFLSGCYTSEVEDLRTSDGLLDT